MLDARRPEGGAAVALRVHAQVVRSGANYRLLLELESKHGHANRSLTHAHCGPLAEAAAVLIVLAMQTDRSPAPQAAPAPELEALDPAQAPAPATPHNSDVIDSVRQVSPAAAVEQLLPSSSAPPQTEHDEPLDSDWAGELHLQLSAALRADLGTFPHEPALGIQAQIAARMTPLYLALGATYWPARDQRSLSYPTARLRGSGTFFDLGLGADLSTSPVVLNAALNVELGQLNAEAIGIAGPERNHVFSFALGPSGSAAVSVLRDWSVAFELSGLVPIYRAHWLVRTPQGDVPAFDAAPLVLRAAIRVGYALH